MVKLTIIPIFSTQRADSVSCSGENSREQATKRHLKMLQTMRGGVVTILLVMLCSSSMAFFGMKTAPAPVELQETDLVDNESCRSFITSISGKPSYISVRSFGSVLRKGLYACAKVIVQTASSQVALEYKDVFEAEQRQVTNELASLKSAIESSLPMKSVSPAFQWAQVVQCSIEERITHSTIPTSPPLTHPNNPSHCIN